jgi:hypothetical protein
MILIVGVIVFLLILIGAWMAIQEAAPGSVHAFDYFFLGGVALAFGLANYLWFISNNRDVAQIISVWATGNIAVALYFRSMFTRSSPKK